MKIGFLGLGKLGTPIAENLLQSTQQLYVYNRTAAKAQPLADRGAVICSSVAELATLSDVVFTLVSDDAALQAVTAGEEGIAANLKKGGVHVSLSTILPATATSLAQLHDEHGSHYIACAILGRPEAARAKKLNLLVSGNTDVFETIRPVLEQCGAANIWAFGSEVGAANVAKLCSNFLIVSAMESMAESIHLARQSGIDAEQLMHMLTQTLFASPVYSTYGNSLLKEAFLPAGFTLKLGLKDVNLINEQASAVGVQLPFGKKVQELMNQCVEQGLGEHDWTAIALASR